MTFPNRSPGEIEQDRLRRAAELAAESGEEWAAGYRAGEPGCHELLDRTAVLSDMLERHLLHPACVATLSGICWRNRRRPRCAELYQQVGELHLGEEKRTEQGVNQTPI